MTRPNVAHLRFGKTKSKYNNKKVEVDGIRFDSKKEAERYAYLRLMQKVGDITDLVLQPRFPLRVADNLIATYVADFSYTLSSTQQAVVEDVKSPATMTPVYRLKKKLVRALYGIEIVEVQ